MLRKCKDDYLYASLVDRPITRLVMKPEEEKIIELGHYPPYYHYSGGKRDGEEKYYSNSPDVKTYLYHGADGKWYGLVRRDNQKYSHTSGNTDYYIHESYEWFMDTIDGEICSSQKIAAPNGISEFESIGMSGKWLMCYTGSKVYRIDTTNVINIELVENGLQIRAVRETGCIAEWEISQRR